MQPSSNTTQGVGTELLSDAKNVGSSAVNRLHSEVDSRKTDAAKQVKSVSSAIGQAADGLDDNAPTWLKSAFEQGAEQVSKFAATLEQKDSRQLVNDVSDFARTSPGTFLAACAAAGFAASRVFRSGGSTAAAPQSAIGADYMSSSDMSSSSNRIDPLSQSQFTSTAPRGEY